MKLRALDSEITVISCNQKLTVIKERKFDLCLFQNSDYWLLRQNELHIVVLQSVIIGYETNYKNTFESAIIFEKNIYKILTAIAKSWLTWNFTNTEITICFGSQV